MQMMEEVTEQVGMSYHDTPVSDMWLNQSTFSPFTCEEAGSAENSIIIDEHEAPQKQGRVQLHNNQQ